ncbi:MAG TPA: carboxypeptidase-like regulatory domain-containing protein [Ignavibacteriaceae bacterium]|nr:carboxypeptidase-like regulatory domain-containing protein [Ignavibacteriaceae bacterium]
MKQFLLLLLLTPLLIYAGTTGKLSGSVKDAQTGEALVGANIMIVGTDLGAATNVNGSYVILNIPPGNYSVRISFIGYESKIITEVGIVVDQTTVLDVTINPQSIMVDEVVVVATTPMIQKDVTSSISVITRDQIDALPVSTFTDLLSLQAGVVQTGNNDLHIRGGRSNEVAYLIDGIYVKDPLLGNLSLEIGNDAIQEMSLLSGTFNAEYGNALSGVVNIVTRDGGDRFTGRVEARTSEFGIDRYSSFHESRINGSLSGPFFTNQINFFISGDMDNRGSYLPYGYNKLSSFFTKLSTSIFPYTKISLQNRGSQSYRQGYDHSFKYIGEQYLRAKTDSWQSSLTFTHTPANNFFYDIRASYFNQGYYSGIDKDTSEYLATFQREYFSEYGNGFEFYKLADPLSLTDSRTATADFKVDAVWQIDNFNEVKMGAQYQNHWLRLFYVFDPKRNFPYRDSYNTEPFEIAGYIQDKIELPYLVLNLGLRYDYSNANVTYRADPLNPETIITAGPKQQLSPRIGIAHPISDRSKLHFSYGHFFQNPEFQYMFENNMYDLNVREPLFGQADLDAERTISYEVGVSHQFTDRIATHLTAYYRDITGLIGTRYFFPFVEGRYTGYTLYVNEDYANVKGFEFTLDIRPDRYFSGGLTYTYMVAKGSASSETEQYPGTQESTQLYYLNFDRTHVINFSATLRVPENEGPPVFGAPIFENMDISLIVRASSGAPYTPAGRDVGFVERNSLRQPGIYTIDMIIGKSFYFMESVETRFFMEIYNLTDHQNILYVYPDTGDPDYTVVGNQSQEYMQDPSNYGPPRVIRLGASIGF